MSSLSRQQRTTRMHDNSSLVHVITRIHHDYEHSDVSREKMSIFSEKLDRLWSNLPARLVNIEGYHVVDYLERLLIDEKIHDEFFILLTRTMATNVYFYHLLLSDHQRFHGLFTRTLGKPIYLMRLYSNVNHH
jgi:hypothetical protein